jgi:transposase-like protein
LQSPKKYSDELRERARGLPWSPGARSRRSRAVSVLQEEALRTSVRQAKADAAGGTPSPLTTAERERRKELEREVRELRKDNEIVQGRVGVFRQGARLSRK